MNPDKDDSDEKIDPIIIHIGDMGRYQFWFSMLMYVSKFPAAWVCLGHIFLAAPTKYECVDPEGSDPCLPPNCQKSEHNRSTFKEPIVTEFDLVCERAWLSSLTQTFVMMGIIVGSLAFGILADKIGRRPSFLISVIAEIGFGILVTFTSTYWSYPFSRFAVSCATGGTMMTGFILVMEMLGSNKREIMTILYQLPFMMGHATLPLFSYYFRYWRLCNLSYSTLTAGLVINICLGIESPRRYFTTGRIDKSIYLLEKIARTNRKSTEDIRPQVQEAYSRNIAHSVIHKGAVMDLFRTPNLRMKATVMAYLWLDTCMVYYGVSQYISTLSGDIYINVAISGILGCIGTLVCLSMLQCVGRRCALICINFFSAITLLVMAVIPKEYNTVIIGLATIGLCGSAMMFCIIYLYAGELFPTVVCNSAVGLCSLLGRAGSMIAPHISDLARFSSLLPPCIFGTMCLLGGSLTLLLPETAGYALPKAIDDSENFGQKAAKSS